MAKEIKFSQQIFSISLLANWVVAIGTLILAIRLVNNMAEEGIKFLQQIYSNSLLANWVVAIGTLVLAFTTVFVTIFKDTLRKLATKPKLEIEIDVAPPDCHKTYFNDVQTGEKTCDCYYFRFKIWNGGNDRAENVEILLTKLFKKETNGSYKEEKDFLPMNLFWSHYKTSFMGNICPDTFKYCDLGCIIKKGDLNKLIQTNKEFRSKILFIFDIAVKPNTLSYIKEPGEYAIEVMIASANITKAEKRYFKLEINDSWTDDTEEMLGKIIIKKTNSIG